MSIPPITDAATPALSQPKAVATAPSRGLPRRARWGLAALAVAALAVGAAACATDDSGSDSDSGSEISATTEPDRDEVIVAADTDEDGVVTREAFEESAEDAAVRALLDDGTAIAAAFPGGQLTIEQVLASIAESPPSPMDDSNEPTRDQFVSRLTSMLQLRLVAVALTELGFTVDVSASDADINTMAQAQIAGPFEAFAQERSVSEDPSISRLATPHCVSALVLESEQDALAATERVRGGEPLAEVAAEVNHQGLTDPNGVIECNLPLDMFGTGQLPLTLIELPVGEFSEPVLLPSGVSPTGELWVVLHLDDLLTDQTDLASVGPFAPRVLSGLMITYEVDVAPALGTWTQSSLSVALPQPGS